MYFFDNYDLDLNNIPVIPKDRNYWLVRADGGLYYDDFFLNSYIGIGYNAITEDIINSCYKNLDLSIDDLKAHVKKIYPDENRPGLVAGYIKIMKDVMKKDDIVIVPSRNAESLNIGLVNDDIRFLTKEQIQKNTREASENDYDISNFTIRRSVQWIKAINKNQIDMRFYKALFSHNTISNINDYDFIIDRTCFPYYIKNGKFHFLLQIKSTDDVSLSFYSCLFNTLDDIIDECRREVGNSIQFDKTENIVAKIQVESPGYIELSSIICDSSNISEKIDIDIIDLILENANFIPIGLLAFIVIGGLCGLKINYKSKDGKKFSADTPGLIGSLAKLFNKSNNPQKEKIKDLKKQIKKLQKSENN